MKPRPTHGSLYSGLTSRARSTLACRSVMTPRHRAKLLCPALALLLSTGAWVGCGGRSDRDEESTLGARGGSENASGGTAGVSEAAGADSGTTCLPRAGVCERNEDCCSRLCWLGVCEFDCLGTGEACTPGVSPCCAGPADRGDSCSYVSFQCLCGSDASRCRSDADCCSGYCYLYSPMQPRGSICIASECDPRLNPKVTDPYACSRGAGGVDP
jgi:hypothetical protein